MLRRTETVKLRKPTAALFGLFLVAACSGGGDATTTTSTPADTTTTSADDATITIASFAFGDPITVSVGEVVTVVNQDGVSHTWTSTDGLFDSGSLSGGEEFTHTFEEAGEYRFFCGIHPEMTGSITVEG